MKANVKLYGDAAYAAHQLGRTEEAFLLVEAGKTRHLAQVLELDADRPPGVSETVWQRFQNAAEQAKTAYLRAEQAPRQPIASENPVDQYQNRVASVRAASTDLKRAVEEVRRHIPEGNFLGSLDLPAIQALLPDLQTALVTFCFTEKASLVFLITRNAPVQVVQRPHFLATTLHRLLFGEPNDRTSGGWIADLSHPPGTRMSEADLALLQKRMDRVLDRIGAELLAPALECLPGGIQRLLIAPTGGLFLLPLHAAPLRG
ncbi:MAG: hypothetical protein ACKVX9_13950, partial [Blastocatellia bacterium]